MKDHFSTGSEKYARFRPTYPPKLYTFLLKFCNNRNRAWDCATGNGQVAGELAKHFLQVQGTDISINQLANAVQRSNLQYSKQPAEKTTFPKAYFDLVTVGQAVHWFEFDRFFTEVKRVLKKDAVIAIFGYALFESNPETDDIIRFFYNEIIGPYWQPERRYLEEKYRTIPFPFSEVEVPELFIKQQWTIERLLGYLKTWSAVKSYEEDKGRNPVDMIRKELQQSFGELGPVNFPILLRVGKNI